MRSDHRPNEPKPGHRFRFLPHGVRKPAIAVLTHSLVYIVLLLLYTLAFAALGSGASLGEWGWPEVIAFIGWFFGVLAFGLAIVSALLIVFARPPPPFEGKNVVTELARRRARRREAERTARQRESP